MIRASHFFAMAIVGLFPVWAQAQVSSPVQGRRSLDWVKVGDDEFDRRALTELGQQTLQLEGLKWEHAQSDHFVVHFEKEIFARKVGRMAEFYYAYIADDVGGPEDIVDGRSHIFVFREPEAWQKLRGIHPATQDWVFAFVRGPEMFLQQARDTKSSAGVLAHEMSHLILNRFFRGRPPTWLNEGLAEWYGEFAYAAFKGIKKSRRKEFKRQRYPFPIEQLMVADTYPSDTAQVTAFYETAKFVVGFLRLSWPDESFVAFLQGVMSGGDVRQGLEEHFGLEGPAAVQEGFEKFLR